MTADQHRRAVRRTAENVQPGDRLAPWNAHFQAHRLVLWAHHYENEGLVLIQWADGTATTHTAWSMFHLATPNQP